MPAQAQSTATLVSNHGQSDDSNEPVHASRFLAQEFHTGSHTHLYNLDSIGISVDNDPDTVRDNLVTATIRRDNGNDPGTVLYTLTTPASIGRGTQTFNAPSGAKLDPNTDYWVVVAFNHTATGDFKLDTTTDNSEDSGGGAGWSIGNSARQSSNGTSWSNILQGGDTLAIRISVDGSERTNPGITVLSNSAQTIDSSVNFPLNLAAQAQSFTAGHDAVLSRVRLRFDTAPGNLSRLSVKLWSNSGSEPGSELATFYIPGSVPGGDALTTFAAPSGVRLDKGSTYWIVVSYNRAGSEATPKLSSTGSTSEDSSDTLDGWSAGNTVRFRLLTSSGSWSSQSANGLGNQPFSFKVNGSLIYPVLVSNAGQDQDAVATVNSSTNAQSFTAAHDATLGSVGVRFDTSPATDDNLTAELWSNSGSDLPDSKIADLSNPAFIADDSLAEFTAPANTFLDAGSTYWILLDYNRSGSETVPTLSVTNANSEDDASLDDWSIGNSRRTRVRSLTGPWGSAAGTRTSAARIEVRGTAITPPVLVGAEVTSNGNRINLKFDQSVDTLNLPDVSDFTVTAGGGPVAVGSVIVLTDSATNLSGLALNGLTPKIGQGQAVVVTYTDPSGDDDASAVQNAAGLDALSFTTGQGGVAAVVNSSTFVPPWPVIQSATVQATGDRVDLVFNIDVHNNNSRAPSRAPLPSPLPAAPSPSGTSQ